MGLEELPPFVRKHYDYGEWKHACAILRGDFPGEWKDLMAMLTAFRLKRSWIATGGGNKSAVSKWIETDLGRRGWAAKSFETIVSVDGKPLESPTHEVDCFKNRVALEIEWNNKDPFFDRDLNNFRLLFDLRAVSVGVILTRSDELQDVFNSLGRGSSYGMSTTHWSKLEPKIIGGGGGGCPILALGIRRSLYVED